MKLDEVIAISEKLNPLDNAIKNVSRFSNLSSAKRWENNQVKPGLIFLGDDGKYWVAANLRDASILHKAGYERITKN